MVARATPDAPAETVLTAAKIEVLDRVAGGPPSAPDRTVSDYLLQVLQGITAHDSA